MFVLDKRYKALGAAQHSAAVSGMATIEYVLPLMLYALEHLATRQRVARHAGRYKVIDVVVLVPRIGYAVIYASSWFITAPKAHGTVHRYKFIPVFLVRPSASAICHVALKHKARSITRGCQTKPTRVCPLLVTSDRPGLVPSYDGDRKPAYSA